MLEALAAAVAAQLEGGAWNDPPVYVIVPDAAALACEREILRRLQSGGSMRLRVSSPARAATAILRSLGRAAPEPLSSGAMRAQVRVRAAALGTLAALSLPTQAAAGAERRLAQTIEELFWHGPEVPPAAQQALGKRRFEALRQLAQAFAMGTGAVPEGVLHWRAAAALRVETLPGSVHWAVPPGLPALEALREALHVSGMVFTDWHREPPTSAGSALRDGVEVTAYACRDVGDEARAAVLRCRDLLFLGTAPDEIAIGCADDALRSRLGRLLRAARIPADFGATEPQGQPLTECLGGLLALAADGMRREALLRVVGSGLVPTPGADRDRLLAQLRTPFGAGAEAALPAALAPGVQGWPQAASFRDHLRHFAAWLHRLRLPDAGSALGVEAQAVQDAIWNAFWSLAEAAGANSQEAKVPKDAAIRAIGDLLGAAVPSAGPRRGAVRVLRAGGLAGADVPHLLLLGLSERAFPVSSPQGILSPDVLAAAAQAGAAIGRGPDELRRSSQAAALSAIAAAGRSLWLSFAALDAQGRAQGFSPLAAEIAPARAWLPPEPAVGGLGAALSPEEAGVGVAAAIARRREIGGEASELMPLAAAHLELFGRGPHFAGFAPRQAEEPIGEIQGEIAVTALEQFGVCRFRWLGQRLGLRSNEPSDALDPRQRGTLVHRVLSSLAYDELSDEGLAGAVRAAVDEAVAADEELSALRDAAGARGRALREETASEILRAARMLAAERRASAFRVLGREVAFGAGKDLGPLEVPLPDGGTAHLRGRIDRLEEAQGLLRVTDFKVRSQHHFDISLVLHGVDVQVGAYLLAALRSSLGRGKQGAAAAYWPVRFGVRTPKRAEEPSDEAQWQEFRQRGLFLGRRELLPLLDGGHPAGHSPFHPLTLKADGDFTQASPAVPENLWPAMEEYIASTLGRLAQGLLRGEADPNPYRHKRENACRGCDLLPICRYEAGFEGFRRLEPASLEVVRGA